MRKVVLLLLIALMPVMANATYSNHHYNHSKHSYNKYKNQYSSSKHQKKSKHYSYNKYKHNNKHHNGSWGNPLVGHKMPKGCKWVWVNGKKETRCGKKDHKMDLAKFCAKRPQHRKCKDKPVTNVSEPAPIALLVLALGVALFARRRKS